MADKPDMSEVQKFNKTQLKKTKTTVKNPLPSKEELAEAKKEVEEATSAKKSWVILQLRPDLDFILFSNVSSTY